MSGICSFVLDTRDLSGVFWPLGVVVENYYFRKNAKRLRIPT